MAKDYDKILTRLIGIITKISSGELLDTKEFAREFGVSVRTIQKDIYQKLGAYPIVKDKDGKFRFIEGFSINKSTLSTDEMILLSLSLSQFHSVKDFQTKKESILSKLQYPHLFNPYYIKQAHLEDLDEDIHKKLVKAIKEKNIVKLQLTCVDVEVEPYKLTNFDGFWYLFAKDRFDGKIKAYRLYRIKNITILDKVHKVSQSHIDKVLEHVHSSWFEDGESYEIVVKIEKNISHYFKRRKFLRSQKILKEYEDGSIKVSFEVSHDEDIDNIIKSWLPDVEILEPKRYKEQVLSELREYLNKYD